MRGMIRTYLLAVASKSILFLNLTKPVPFSEAFDSAAGSSFVYDSSVFGVQAGSIETLPTTVKRVLFYNLKPILVNTTFLLHPHTPILDWNQFLQIPQLYPELESPRSSRQ